MPNEDHNQNDLNNELDEFQDEINENSEQYDAIEDIEISKDCLLYTSPSPRDI